MTTDPHIAIGSPSVVVADDGHLTGFLASVFLIHFPPSAAQIVILKIEFSHVPTWCTCYTVPALSAQIIFVWVEHP